MTNQINRHRVLPATPPAKASRPARNSVRRRMSMKHVVAPVLSVLVAAGLSAAPASAAPGSEARSARPLPKVLNLPNGFSPEGIAIDERVAYTGSLVDGSIQRIDLKTGAATRFAPSPGPSRVAVGMHIDRFDRLWVAGGGTGFGRNLITSFRVYDTRSGAALADVAVPEAVFLNDVFVTRDAAWFTDSFGPNLIRVPIGANGKIGSPEKVVLGGDWTGLTANGIVATPDGKSLIVGKFEAAEGSGGVLYVVPTDSVGVANARRITLHGHLDAVAAGTDGLVLNGQTLYTVNSGGVVEIKLSRSLTTGQVLGTTEVPGAAWPTTAKRFGSRLYVIDGNFGENFSNIGNPTAAFKVVAIPMP
jgi:sugar lactone lactonase YvrE